MTNIIVNLGNIDNTVTYGNSDYAITAADGNNTLTLGSGTDTLTLGNGNNSLTLNGGVDQIVAGTGNNTITTTGTGADTVTLGSGNNTVVVGDGPDTISAGDGLNTVTTGNGNSSVTLGNGFDQVTTGNGNNEIIVGNGAADTITVGTGSNTIAVGSGSADVIHTGGGRNTVTLSAAAASGDTIMGGLTTLDGSGNTLDFTTAGIINASSVSGFQTYQLSNGGSSSLTLTDANFARLPGGSVTVQGGNTGATIDASGLSAAHSVIIHAGSGTDILTGGAGNDTFYGASGTATVNGGAGINTMIFSGPRSSYSVTLGVGGVVNVVGPNTADSLTNIQNIRFTENAPTALALAPSSDSGISQSDDITNVTQPIVTGVGNNGDTVTLYDGTAAIGTGTVSGGVWSIAATVKLNEGLNAITATQVNTLGDVVSNASAVLNVTLDTIPPAVTAVLAANPLDSNSGGMVFSQVMVGNGDPNATVTIADAGTTVATTQASSAGTWSFDPSTLPQGTHSLVASETDLAGNTGSTFALTTPNLRFGGMDMTTSTSGSLAGSDYTGPVGYLQAEYAYTGSDNVVISARVANVFIYGGSGEEALVAKAGSNVLAGGSGSNWLVGASGTDGGTDTFFVDGRGGQATWDTLLNFHTGDSLTLWGFNAAAGSTSWAANQGATGYQGATLHVDFNNGTGASALVTLAGVSGSSAHFATTTGASNGIDFLMVTRTA